MKILKKETEIKILELQNRINKLEEENRKFKELLLNIKKVVS